MPCSFRLDRSKIPGIGDQGANLGDGCQFGVSEEDLYGAGQNKFCGFHLPIGQEEKSRIDLDWFNEQLFGYVNEARKEDHFVDLSGVHFPGPISFDGYTEQNSLPDVLFARAQFGGDVSFRGTNFSGAAVFLSAQFNGRLDFDEATFNDIAVISSTVSNRRASFLGSEFRGNAEFRNAVWNNDVQFDKAIFNKSAEFFTVAFQGIAQFCETVFRHQALFVGTAFGGEANFANARFDREAFFNPTAFGGPLICHDATFGGDALFGGGSKGFAQVRELPAKPDIHNRIIRASFRRAAFSGRADFSNRDFIGKTDFRDAVFNVAPEFYGSELHQDTDFAGAEFRDHKGNNQVDAPRAYRTLKLAMEQARATREQAKFFRHEQRSLRLRSDTPRSLKAISWLYELTSDYGESPIRPLVGVGLAFVAFFIVYLAIQTCGKAIIGWAEIEATLLFTARQVFMPFRIFISDPPPSLGLALLAAVHSLLNISFIALFIIALRRKFRLV